MTFKPRHGHCLKGIPSKTHKVWWAMVRRCTDKNTIGWADYGGRGIKVCERWLTFENFLADMGEVPEGLTLDRIDSDGNYEPGNARYATRKEQQRNRRNNRLATINGVTKCVAEWCEEYGLPKGMFFARLNAGWQGEDLLKPVHSTQERLVTINGETKRLAEWGRVSGLNPVMIAQRIDKGWPEEKWLQPSRKWTRAA